MFSEHITGFHKAHLINWFENCIEIVLQYCVIFISILFSYPRKNHCGETSVSKLTYSRIHIDLNVIVAERAA